MIDKAAIEQYLLTHPGWVTLKELCDHFGLPDDRLLRANGEEPGALSRITIFSGKGVRHLAHATDEEKKKCRSRITDELRSRIMRLRWMDEGEANLHEIKNWPHETEKSTGQVILL